MKKKKILKFLLWSFVGFLTLVALLYAWIDWSGNRAWKKVEAELLAKGEPLRLEQVIPPPIPDAQNFAFSPLFKDVFEIEAFNENGEVSYRSKHPEATKRLEAMDLPRAPYPASMEDGRTDMAAWQTYFRANPEFHLSKEIGNPADEVLEALGNWIVPLDGIARDLRARPLMRAPVRYDLPFAMGISQHYTALFSLSRLYQLRALALIRQRRSAEAFADLETLFLLIKAAEPRQTMIGNIVALSNTALIHPVIREGLAARIWDEKQLSNLAMRLEFLRPLADFSSSVRFERVLVLDALRSHSSYFQLRARINQGSPGSWEGVAIKAASLLHRGFWDYDRTAYTRWTQYTLEEVLTRNEERFNDSGNRFYGKEIAKLQDPPAGMRHLMTSQMLHNTPGTGSDCARISGLVTNMRAAVAVEQYRLSHGTAPDYLAALTPAFLTKPLIDPWQGQPLRYRKLSDMGYRIWSAGPDGKDDGEKKESDDRPWESLPPQ